MLNEVAVYIVILLLGILVGSVVPGFIGHLVLQYKKFGFSIGMLWGFFRSVGLFLLLGFLSLLLLGFTLTALDIPMEHEPSNAALGFGLLIGCFGGSAVLLFGVMRSRKSAG